MEEVDLYDDIQEEPITPVTHDIQNKIDATRERRDDGQNDDRRIFVGGLAWGTDENVLREYFSKYGNITNVNIPKDMNGRARGFAFVTFETSDPVQVVVDEAPHMIKNRRVDIRKAGERPPRRPRSPPRNRSPNRSNSPRRPSPPPDASGDKIFVGGFRPTSNEALKSFFESKVGRVRDAVIMEDKFTGKSRGFAFVTFLDPQDAREAVAQVGKLNLEGRVLDIKFAVPRGQAPPPVGQRRQGQRPEYYNYEGQQDYYYGQDPRYYDQGYYDAYYAQWPGYEGYGREGYEGYGRDAYGYAARDSYGGRDAYGSGRDSRDAYKDPYAKSYDRRRSPSPRGSPRRRSPSPRRRSLSPKRRSPSPYRRPASPRGRRRTPSASPPRRRSISPRRSPSPPPNYRRESRDDYRDGISSRLGSRVGGPRDYSPRRDERDRRRVDDKQGFKITIRK